MTDPVTGVHVALLRGINVGGHGKLPMADLRTMLTDLGASDVQTCIQSGNAVFRGDVTGDALSDAIAARHGFRPAVLVLTAERLTAARNANPFPDATATPKALHLFFPAKAVVPDIAALDAACAPGERWAQAEGAIFLHAPGGLSASRLAPRLERLLATPVTARNWATVTRLCDMAADQGAWPYPAG